MISRDQRIAARVVGITYLFVNLTATVNELFVRGPMIVDGNALKTAQNIVASQILFRGGIVVEVCAFVGDVVLAAAFYILLSPVNQGIALFGSLARIVNAALLTVALAGDLAALHLLAGQHLGAFSVDQLQTLAQLALGMHDSGLVLATIFLSLGSICSSYLLLKGRYVPRPLAQLGVLASALALAYLLTLIVYPPIGNIAFPWSLLPLLLFELVTGFWLTIKGIDSPANQGAATV